MSAKATDVTDLARARKKKKLARLVLAGNLMASRLTDYADDLDVNCGVDANRPERDLVKVWNAEVKKLLEDQL